MKKAYLMSNLKHVEHMARTSRLNRMRVQPIRYTSAILHRALYYKYFKKEKEVVGETFFDVPMHLLLPSSTDIYLTKGKSHHSEIRLARYLINHLNPGDSFLDVGAHYGYFSLLAATLVENTGIVVALEAAPTTFSILQKNAAKYSQLTVYNNVVSDETKELTFYEFPNQYSEYNTLNVDQFKDDPWFQDAASTELKIQSIVLDSFLSEHKLNPHIIKIDVEGAEYKVLHGMQHFLTAYAPKIVIEYLDDTRGNTEHKKAENLLRSLAYVPYIIDSEGMLQETENINKYMQTQKLDSDNIVFIKYSH